MKLKFMLRGIGIGLIMSSTLFFALKNKGNATLSDEEIMKKAGELGMVTRETLANESLDKLKNDIIKKESGEGKDGIKASESTVKAEEKEASTPSKASETEAEFKKSDKDDKAGKSETSQAGKEGAGADKENSSDSEGRKNSATEDKKVEEKTNQTAEGQAGIKKTEADTKDKAEAEEVKEEKSDKQNETPKKTYTYTVIPGSSAVRLCKDFEAMGLIKDASDFNHYLAVNNYAKRIQNGTFTFTGNESYHEMAERLVSKKPLR